MNKWNFPENGNGQIKGISDAGIETFNGKELKALTRETIQNSLDASNSEKPVKVCFFKHRIFNKNIPGIEDYTYFIPLTSKPLRKNGKRRNPRTTVEIYNESHEIIAALLINNMIPVPQGVFKITSIV